MKKKHICLCCHLPWRYLSLFKTPLRITQVGFHIDLKTLFKSQCSNVLLVLNHWNTYNVLSQKWDLDWSHKNTWYFKMPYTHIYHRFAYLLGHVQLILMVYLSYCLYFCPILWTSLGNSPLDLGLGVINYIWYTSHSIDICFCILTTWLYHPFLSWKHCKKHGNIWSPYPSRSSSN